MGRFVVYLSVGIAATLCVLPCNSAIAAEHRMIKGVIAKVVDGDTLWVQSRANNNSEDAAASTKPLKVRMISIDAPETHLPTPQGVKGQQPWGDQATTQLNELSPLGKSVSVEDFGTDKYDRMLARVYVGDNDVNLDMVRSGWAIPYIICEKCEEDFFKKENTEDYLSACEQARKKGIGIWNKSKPLKEMPFEFRLRMQNRKPEKFVGSFSSNEYYAPADYDKVDVCDRVFFMREADAKKAGFAKAR